METIILGSKCAALLDQVAGLPPGTPFTLAAPTGQMLFFGTRVTYPGVPVAHGLAKTSVIELLKAFVLPLAAAFGLPVAQVIGVFQRASATNSSDPANTPKAQWQIQRNAPAFDDFFARLRKAQEGRKLSPGKPPEVLKLGDTTFTVYDNITLMGDLTLVGDVIVPAPKTVAGPQHKKVEARSTGHSLLGDPQKANEIVNFLGEGVDTFSKFYPDFERHVAEAGDIIDALAILTSTFGLLDAINKEDNRAVVGYSLTLGAGAIDLLGAVSGCANLRNVALLLKFSKTGWTLFCPSKGKTRA